MQRAILVVSLLALVLTALAVVCITAVFLLGHSLYWVERGSGGTLLEQLFNLGPLLPIALTLLAWALSLISAVYRRQRGWVALLLLFVPVGYVFWFDLLSAYVAVPTVGVALPLLLPLTTWLYGRRAFGPPLVRAGEAM